MSGVGEAWKKSSQPNLFEPAVTASFISPMLACALPEGKTIDDYRDGWMLEEKYDGHRVIIHVSEERHVTVWSRQGNVKTLPFHLVSALKKLPGCTADGEMYIPGGISTDVTDKLRQHELKIVLFDLLAVGAQEAMTLASSHRRRLLLTAAERLEGNAVTVAPQFPVSAEGLQQIWDRGGEGAVIKRDCTYRAGKRVKEWIKFKREQAAEGTVIGFVAGKEAGSTPHSIIVALDRHGVEVRMKSLNDAWRAAFATRSHEVLGKTIVFSYQERTRDGRYRHPMADHIIDWEP
jgi:ATP-dependent DNA ligase